MAILTPIIPQEDNGLDGREASPVKSTRDQNASRTVSGDRLTSVMLAGDVRYGNYSRADLAAQGSLQSVSIGTNSRASTFSNDAQYNGLWSTTQTYNTAVGPSAQAWGMQNTALGGKAAAGRDGVSATVHEQATAIGAAASAQHNKASALGAKAIVQLEDGVALGAEAILSEGEATVIGTGEINAQPGDTIKIRYNTRTASKGGVSVGSYYKQRQIKNIADATDENDAVTLRQLLDVVRQLNATIPTAAAFAEQSASPPKLDHP